MPGDWWTFEEERERAASTPEREAPEARAPERMSSDAARLHGGAFRVSEPGDRWEREAHSLASTLSSKLDPGTDAGARPDRLPPSIVGVMRRELGADVSGVPLRHAPDAAASIGAKAYTLGGAIHTGAGVTGARGRETLLHEAVHALQQGAAPARAGAVTPAPAGVAQRVTGGQAEPGARSPMQIVRDWLSKPATFALLVEHCGSEDSIEIPLSIGAIRAYKRAPTEAKARNIFNYFVQSGSDGELNIPFLMRRQLTQLFDDPTRAGEIDGSVFDELEFEQIRLMKGPVSRIAGTALLDRGESWLGKADFKAIDVLSRSQRSQAFRRGFLYQTWIGQILDGNPPNTSMELSTIAAARLASVYAKARKKRPSTFKTPGARAARMWRSLRGG